jgi:hypothetical protein
MKKKPPLNPLIYHWTKEHPASTFLAKESYKLPKPRKNTFVNLKTLLNVLKETVPAEEFKGSWGNMS